MTPTPGTPLERQALELCWQIERLPASEQQTTVSIAASALHRAVQTSEQALQRVETVVAVARRMASLEPEAVRGLNFTELRNLWAELVVAVVALPPDTPTDEPEDCVTGSDHIPGPFE